MQRTLKRPKTFIMETEWGTINYEQWCVKMASQMDSEAWIHFVKNEGKQISIWRKKRSVR